MKITIEAKKVTDTESKPISGLHPLMSWAQEDGPHSGHVAATSSPFGTSLVIEVGTQQFLVALLDIVGEITAKLQEETDGEERDNVQEHRTGG